MGTKFCRGCQQEKPLDQFSWKNRDQDRLQPRCKECQSLAQADWYQRNSASHKASVSRYNLRLRDEKRALVQKIKETTPCADCGRFGHFAGMDFDHLENKKFNVSRMVTAGFTLKNLLNEIDKCEVVCAYCHRIRTWDRSQVKTR